ncbi:MAG TPA: AMP-binding protein, partial [Candidatus Polarisedimenticolia bacterium]|nr:AMP-binding protein [Candidatus Polarisedimenticolia bacterium]
MQASRILDEAVRLRPDGPAVLCGDTALSYSQIRRRVGRLAAAFTRLGVVPGERIAILHRNCHRFFESYFAALHLGAVLVPLNPRLAARELKTV